MNMESNHIDDIFRLRLHDTETPPPAFVWDNVERELKKRKRRLFFFWFFAIGLAGAGLWALLPAPSSPTADRRIESHNAETLKPADQTQAANKLQNSAETPDQGSPTAATAQASTKRAVEKGIKSVRQSMPVTGRLTPGKTPSAPMPVSADPKYADGIPNTIHEPVPASNEPFAMLPASTEQTSLVFQRGQTMSKAKAFIRKKKDPKYCYNFAENPNVWMVEAYAGPSFNKRSLQAGIPAFESYAQMRRNTEHPDWSFNAGVRGALLLKRHWLLRTGLHYEQMTEVFEYADPSYIKYIVEIINQPGEPTIIDTVGVEYGENYVKTFNRYGMIDVPLEMGAELRSGRFGLSLHAGLSVNVFFWKRGTVLSPGNQPKPFTPGAKDATEIFRTRTGLSATGSAQMFVHLKPTVRVFAEPYFRKVLKPVTLDNQAVDARFSNWGIKFGMTKILN